MIKLYVGCALTHASPEFKQGVENIKAALKDEFEVLEFLGLAAGTEKDVYRHDIHTCVANCDIFVAICDEVSIGLGYELATSVEKHGKPTLGVAHQGARVTRLVLGIDHPNFTFGRYNSMDQVPDMVRKFARTQIIAKA